MLIFQLFLLCLVWGSAVTVNDWATNFISRGNVKINIINNTAVQISLRKSFGVAYILRIGQQIPLQGELKWYVGTRKFYSAWKNGMQLFITSTRSQNAGRRLRIRWKAPPSVNSIVQCVPFTDDEFWFGGTELPTQNWLVNNQQFSKMPYLPGNNIGNIMAPYFLSSKSVSISVPRTTPLFMSVNRTCFCFTAEFQPPYRNTDGRALVLQLNIAWNQPGNVTALWLSDSATIFGYPTAVPSAKIIRDPIWSTWVFYKADISQEKALNFVREIHGRIFPVGHIEIDDNWESCYGNLDFNRDKFPEPDVMVREIKKFGYNVSLWVHPFINVNCSMFAEAAAGGFLVTVNGTEQAGITRWWQGKQAGIIDVTKPAAVHWWRRRLEKLMTDFGVVAFKFDAGETTFLPDHAYLWSRIKEHKQPGDYTTSYARFAQHFGGEVEARVGYFSQTIGGIFIRILDRDSVWGLDNGLHSVITSTLHVGLVGYPFVLPDYIGGNAYGNWPDRELFIRWTQMNAFLPVMQFSIPPWTYDDEVSNISLRMIELHRQVAPVLEAAAQQALLDGAPIIRPLWWIDHSSDAFLVDDQFLVGSTYMVAPVVKSGGVSRDIYVPTGNWTDMLQGGAVTGPIWLRNYTISLQQIAYFKFIL